MFRCKMFRIKTFQRGRAMETFSRHCCCCVEESVLKSWFPQFEFIRRFLQTRSQFCSLFRLPLFRRLHASRFIPRYLHRHASRLSGDAVAFPRGKVKQLCLIYMDAGLIESRQTPPHHHHLTDMQSVTRVWVVHIMCEEYWRRRFDYMSLTQFFLRGILPRPVWDQAPWAKYWW